MYTDNPLHTLAEARREVQAIRPDSTLGPHRDGLTFARATFLAADPRRWTSGERSHAQDCRLCARLAERIRALVHPGWPVLADHAAGRLDSRSARLLEEHVSGCSDCARRLAELKSKRDGVLRLEQALPVIGATAEWTSADRRWQARLSVAGDGLLLEVRPRQADPARRLLGVLLRGADGRERMCYLMTHPEPGSSAQIRFDPRQLQEAIGPQLLSVTVLVLEPYQLTPEDRTALLDSLQDVKTAPQERGAWCAWLGEAGQDRTLSDEVRRLLHDVQRRLT